jgi:DNA-binding CsgD family transcriptional regulator
MEPPPVQYVTTSDGYNIAYTVCGEGRPLIFLPFGFNHVERVWSQGSGVRLWLEGLALRFRLVQYDGRGQGLSTRGLPESTTIADLGRDLEAVVQRLRFERFGLYATGVKSHFAIRYAIEHPERVDALILHCCPADGSRLGSALYSSVLDEDWELYLRTRSPAGLTLDQLAENLDYLRQSTNEADFKTRSRAERTSNVQPFLPDLAVPTLVLHPRDYIEIRTEDSAKVAALIPDARLVLIDGAWLMGDVNQGLAAIDEFLASLPSREAPIPARASDAAPDGLSQREVEVLRLIAAGKSNPQIADELVISINTVQRHVSNILGKTGLANRTEAAGYARDKA